MDTSKFQVMNGDRLKKNLKTFLRHIDSIRDTLPMTMLLLQPFNSKANERFMRFVKEKVQEIEDDNGKKKLLVKSNDEKVFETLERNASISSLAGKIIPESLFVSLISQYDAFLTRLLRAIFEIKPEILNNSERNLTFSQLMLMGSIDDAREFVIEKEIDMVLRKSHSDQFDYLENKLGIKLRENLPIWSTFIEITERRNLLVHCDGVISNQYLKNCIQNKCNTEMRKVGERLGVRPQYFIDAYLCLYEISVKLTHTIWRKLLEDDFEDADRDLNNICYNLISAKAYTLADILLAFGSEQRRHFNDAFKNVFVVNRALSKYLSGEKEAAKKILSIKDWSASSDDFKLAYAVLTDNYSEAYSIMRKIGSTGDVDRSDYREWPLFLVIRKEQRFKEIYKEIFNEDYTVLETPMSPIQELISKEIKNNKELKKKTVKKISSNKEKKQSVEDRQRRSSKLLDLPKEATEKKD